MKRALCAAIVIFQVIASAQENKTSGACSPIAPNNNGVIRIQCQGISEKLGTQLLELLNRFAKNQADAEILIAKLDGCLQGVKDVREQQLPWVLSEGQKGQLESFLRGSKAKVSIHVIPTDRNASLIGVDLIKVLKGSGWEVADGLTSDFTLNPTLVGVVIVVSHQDFAEAALLQSALHSIGIEAKGELDEAKKIVSQADSIVIAIGAKPSATPR